MLGRSLQSRDELLRAPGCPQGREVGCKAEVMGKENPSPRAGQGHGGWLGTCTPHWVPSRQLPMCRQLWLCCHNAGNTAPKRDGLGRGIVMVPSPSPCPSSWKMPGLGYSKAEGWEGQGHSAHMRTGLMAFLMLPKAARPSSSLRHLSASSAGFSFSFSGAWRGEGDRLWKQSHMGKRACDAGRQALCTPGFLCFLHRNDIRTRRNLMQPAPGNGRMSRPSETAQQKEAQSGGRLGEMG